MMFHHVLIARILVTIVAIDKQRLVLVAEV